MNIHLTHLDLDTNGNFSLVNITEQVRAYVQSTGITQGQALVFYKHTTGAVFLGEHEAGIIADMQAMFERIAPVDYPYLHHFKAVDFNSHAHMRSALMTCSITIPIHDGDLLLGTYQEILVLDDQSEAAKRQVVVQVIGL